MSTNERSNQIKSIKEVLSQNRVLEAFSHQIEPEPYILTPDEELKIVENEIKRLKDHFRFRGIFKDQQEVEASISEINWEEKVDKKHLFSIANSNKHSQIFHQNYIHREREENKKIREGLIAYWTAEKIYGMMKHYCQYVFGDGTEQTSLIVNNDTLPLIKAYCYFLSRDKRFETELGYSLDKGLLVRGITGLGKTFLAKCVAHNALSPITLISTNDINLQLRRNGHYEVPEHSILYIDDVGTEEPSVMYYGTTISWFKDFIELYYLHEKPFNRLIVSTNLGWTQTKEAYSPRVESRMREMFNVLDVSGEDLRKKK